MKLITSLLFSLMMIPLFAVHHEDEGHSMKEKNNFAYNSTYVIPDNKNTKKLEKSLLGNVKTLGQMGMYTVYCDTNLVQKEAATLMILNSLRN